MDQSGLSADGGANQHEQFLAAHLDIDPTECRDCCFAGAVCLGDAVALNRDPVVLESVAIPPWARLSLGPHTSELTRIAILAARYPAQLQRAPQPFRPVLASLTHVSEHDPTIESASGGPQAVTWRQ